MDYYNRFLRLKSEKVWTKKMIKNTFSRIYASKNQS